MDNEQILLNLYKQQQYDQTRSKLQKLFMVISTIACFVGLFIQLFYFFNWWYVIVSVGFILCIALNTLLL